MGLSLASFSLLSSFLQSVNSKYVQFKLPMIGFEPGSSGIGSNCAINCETTTAQVPKVMTCLSQNQSYGFCAKNSFKREREKILFFCLNKSFKNFNVRRISALTFLWEFNLSQPIPYINFTYISALVRLPSRIPIMIQWIIFYPYSQGSQ